eukprot:jgi/Botrbrau1/19113/Bobra.0077s0026.1
MAQRGKRQRKPPEMAARFLVLVLLVPALSTSDAFFSFRRRSMQEGGLPASLQQQVALLLMRATADRDGSLSDWNAGESACGWSGISCDSSGQVSRINLAGRGLSGQLPLDSSVWSPLSSVQSLDLSGNQLVGFMPPQLGNISSLQELRLNGNKFTGMLPRYLPGDTLRSLDLSNNQLTGTLPVQWESLKQLQTLDLSSNKLLGPLPPQWGALTSLQTLYLSGNDLQGIVPATWHNGSAGMARLSDVSFAGNGKLCYVAKTFTMGGDGIPECTDAQLQAAGELALPPSDEDTEEGTEAEAPTPAPAPAPARAPALAPGGPTRKNNPLARATRAEGSPGPVEAPLPSAAAGPLGDLDASTETVLPLETLAEGPAAALVEAPLPAPAAGPAGAPVPWRPWRPAMRLSCPWKPSRRALPQPCLLMVLQSSPWVPSLCRCGGVVA